MEIFWEYAKAFLVGGAFCAVGQVIMDYTKLTPARILGGLGWYQPLVDFAGAGASVPLTGFGSLLAKGVREAVDKDGFMGILTGGLTASAAGITAAIVFGLIIAVIFKPKEKDA